MGAPVYQPTFTGGELSPSLYARVDLARYGTSFRTGKNFIVRPYGGIVNRPGYEFISEVRSSANRVRLLPFEYSTEVAYVMELGPGYIRFIYRGEYVLAESSDAWSGATTYSARQLVLSGGVVYRSLQDGNLNHTPASSPTWWLANPLSEVYTSYLESDLREISITQSADVVYLAHISHKTLELRRLTPNTFFVGDFANKNGPFAPINSDEAVRVAVSADSGNVQVTSSGPVFTPEMVGSLFYVEEKDLRGQRPWEAGWRNVGVGILTRSDGKVYRASAVPSGGTPTWRQTGGVRPVHDSGRAWDGPQDTRSTGSDTYSVGVEWEYMHSGFGIVLITGYSSPTQVQGTVTSRIPASCIGGIGTPGATWTFVGTGSTTVFSLTSPNNVSPSTADYVVTINGVGQQPDPFYTPPGGIGGGGSQGNGPRPPQHEI